MARIVGALLLSFGFGGFLAWSWAAWPVWPGAAGAILLVLAAVLARRHWDRRRDTAGDEPGPYERRAWHSMVAFGVLSGQLTLAMASGLDIHLGQGNTLAVDNWLLALGTFVGWLILRPRAMARDERDRDMANRGAHVGFRVLIGLLIVLLLILGFAPVVVTERLTPFVLGNVLIILIQLGLLAAFATQLIGYWAASRPETDHG